MSGLIKVLAEKEVAKENAIGRSHGGLTLKIHAVADSGERPFSLGISARNVHDVTVAAKAVGQGRAKSLITDKAYDSNTFRERLRAQKTKPVISSPKYRGRTGKLTSVSIKRDFKSNLFSPDEAMAKSRVQPRKMSPHVPQHALRGSYHRTGPLKTLPKPDRLRVGRQPSTAR